MWGYGHRKLKRRAIEVYKGVNEALAAGKGLEGIGNVSQWRGGEAGVSIILFIEIIRTRCAIYKRANKAGGREGLRGDRQRAMIPKDRGLGF